MFSGDELKYVFFLKCNIKLPKQGQILILKRPSKVVLLLILNVSDYRIQLRMAI